jgi:hypothetical protein
MSPQERRVLLATVAAIGIGTSALVGADWLLVRGTIRRFEDRREHSRGYVGPWPATFFLVSFTVTFLYYALNFNFGPDRELGGLNLLFWFCFAPKAMGMGAQSLGAWLRTRRSGGEPEPD